MWSGFGVRDKCTCQPRKGLGSRVGFLGYVSAQPKDHSIPWTSSPPWNIPPVERSGGYVVQRQDRGLALLL